MDRHFTELLEGRWKLLLAAGSLSGLGGVLLGYFLVIKFVIIAIN